MALREGLGIPTGKRGRKGPTDEREKPTASSSFSFEASLPPIQSAISVAGDGGARVKLDVPETEMDAVIRLAALRGTVFKVTIEPERGSF